MSSVATLSLMWRNLKLNDEAGISSLPDAELFKNLTLMGYNISPNQKFSFQKGEGSGTPTEPHHTPSPEAQPSSRHDLSSLIHPHVTTVSIHTDEPASPLGDDSQGEACPIIFGLEAEQDRANIIKSSTLPYDSPSRVTSLATDEGSMQYKLNELTDLCTRLQRQQTEMASKIATQVLEITSFKARVKLLEDKDGGGVEPPGEDATIKGRSLETGEEAGKEKMVESDTPKKLQEQIDVQVEREMEEQLAREDQRRDEQIARDAEIARIHAKEELQMLIDRLDRNNEIVANVVHPLHLLELIGILKWDTVSHMYKALILLVVPIHRSVGNKMHKAFPLPVMEFPWPEEVPTASKESTHCQKKRDATVMEIALLLKSRRNCQSKSYDSFANWEREQGHMGCLREVREWIWYGSGVGKEVRDDEQ
nr:hypothetical protein [Tanacetum cinerariifolium]